MSLSVSPRVLYVGHRMNDVVAFYGELEATCKCLVEAPWEDSSAVLSAQEPFDLVIIDHCLQELGGALFLERLHEHSPQAERLIIARASETGAPGLAVAREAPVMRALHSPRSSVRLYGAVPTTSPMRERGSSEGQRQVDPW